jgi:hypothetical protein
MIGLVLTLWFLFTLSMLAIAAFVGGPSLFLWTLLITLLPFFFAFVR